MYFWKRDADSNSLAHDKKVYFGGLLLHEIAHEECCPGRNFDVPAMVENAVALALYRNYEPLRRQVIGFLDPADLHVWETSKGTEVDFVCGSRSTPVPVEVKWENRIDRREVTRLKRTFAGRPVILATKAELEMTDEHAMIPVPLLLWALGDASSSGRMLGDLAARETTELRRQRLPHLGTCRFGVDIGDAMADDDPAAQPFRD